MAIRILSSLSIVLALIVLAAVLVGARSCTTSQAGMGQRFGVCVVRLP